MGLLDNILPDWIQLYDGFVKEVGTESCSVNIAAEGEDEVLLPEVAFRAVADGDDSGLTIVPEKGSYVVFAKINGQSDYVLLKTTKLKKLHLNCDEIVINHGDNEGMVKVKELEYNLDQLKSFVDKMHAALPTAFTAILASSSANGALGANSYNGAMAGSNIVFNDMRNQKVKH